MNKALKQIMDSKDTAEKVIEVKEWGNIKLLLKEPVRKIVMDMRRKYFDDISEEELQGLSKKEKVKKIAESVDPNKANKFAMACVHVMVHDLDGNRVFESAEEAEKVLDKKSSLVQTRLIQECQSLISPPTEEGVKKAEGNSEAIPS